MKRRNLLWFVASALLALLAGVLAVVYLNRSAPDVTPVPEQRVVVADSAIAENDVIRADYVREEGRTEFPSGAVVEVKDILGAKTRRDIAAGEVIVMQDIITGTREVVDILEDDIAVALVANDVLSKWGAIMPGDHVDVLFTLDVILEKPMYVDDIRTVEEAALYDIARDQSMDSVSVLTLQNLEVLEIIDEPQVSEDQAQQQEEAPQLPQRALILRVSTQDAVVLKYLRDTIGSIDLALRSPDNETLFDVQPVNINYLVLRYGIVLPQPLE